MGASAGFSYPKFRPGDSRLRTDRVIRKSGIKNIKYSLELPTHKWMLLKDFVTTLLDEQWRYTLIVFTIMLYGYWVSFAMMWYIFSYMHGDFEKENLMNPDFVTCLTNVFTFLGFMIYVIDIQTTVGYGGQYPSLECDGTMYLYSFTVIVGVLVNCVVVGIFVVKMTGTFRGYRGNQFSNKAVICYRDEQLCLIFRVNDAKENHKFHTHIRAYLLEERFSIEGEDIGQSETSLRLENNGKILLWWPQTVVHVIDDSSPFNGLSANDLRYKRFEIILTVSGSSRASGKVTQSRTSYLPREIQWGYRFQNIIKYDKYTNSFIVDYDNFNTTEKV